MSESIVKSKERVKDLGEVYTPQVLVQEILKNIPKAGWEDPNKTFLDPACGNGNILVEVLKEKKKHHDNILCLKSIYGIDISSENVIECRKRLIRICSENNKIEKEAINIVKKNIVCLDSLTVDFDKIFQKD